LEEQNKIYINVRVKAHAKTSAVEKITSRSYKVQVKSLPLKGQANKEVIKVIASYFGVPASNVEIVRGHKSSIKRIAVEMSGE